MDLNNTVIGIQFLNEHEQIVQEREAESAALAAEAEEAERLRINQELAEAENNRRREPFNLVNTMVLMTTMPMPRDDRAVAKYEVVSSSPSRRLVEYPLHAGEGELPQRLVINAAFHEGEPNIAYATLSIKLGSAESETPHELATISEPVTAFSGLVDGSFGIALKMPGDPTVLREEVAGVIREAAQLAGIPTLPESALTTVQ